MGSPPRDRWDERDFIVRSQRLGEEGVRMVDRDRGLGGKRVKRCTPPSELRDEIRDGGPFRQLDRQRTGPQEIAIGSEEESVDRK